MALNHSRGSGICAVGIYNNFMDAGPIDCFFCKPRFYCNSQCSTQFLFSEPPFAGVRGELFNLSCCILCPDGSLYKGFCYHHSAAAFFCTGLWIFNRNLRMTWSCILLSAISLTPLILRNIVSTGYPLYPSSFAGPFPVDWKISSSTLTRFQHYITGYARYPIVIENANREFSLSITKWFPKWWEHLFLADKFMLTMIALGAVLSLVYFNKWRKQFSGVPGIVLFFISLTGVVVWFIHAPGSEVWNRISPSALIFPICSGLERSGNIIGEIL